MEKELREMHEKLDFILETLLNMSKTVEVVKVTPPGTLGEYLQTPAGKKMLMNII